MTIFQKVTSLENPIREFWLTQSLGVHINTLHTGRCNWLGLVFSLFFLLLKFKWFLLSAWFVRVDQDLANGLRETVSQSISVAHEIMNGSTFESGDIWIVGKRSIAPLRSTGTIKVMPNLFYFL